MVRPSDRKQMAQHYVKEHKVPIRVACDAFKISQYCFRYKALLDNENKIIEDWLLRLTSTYKRWGFGLCFMYLRNVKEFTWNHKRVYRIYRELELNLRIKPKKRLRREKPDALAEPSEENQVWSMDFMSDALTDGRPFRVFNVVDDFRRESLGSEVDTSLPSPRIIRYLDNLIEERGAAPKAIRCDNGPEFCSGEFLSWAKYSGPRKLDSMLS